MKRVSIVAGLVFSTLVMAQGGIISSYHPYPQAKRIPVRSCQSNATGFSCPHGRVLLKRTTDGELEITLDLFGQRFPIRFETTPSVVSDVWNTDLNQDGKADVLIKLAWNGNGIMFDSNLTVFALSSQDGYKLTTLSSITFNPQALIFLRGQPVVLHTDLVGASSKRAGRSHNYWVFHPFEVRGAKLVKNQKPIWIQYTYEPNHLPTNKLTSLEKQKALNVYPIQFFETMK